MKNWKLVSLRDVCTLINGRAYKQAELLNEGKYPVLRVGNFFSNRSWYYSDLELDDNKYCDDGDLLYAWSASFGPRIWQGGKVIYHYHIWKTDIDSNKVYKKFLYHWFEWDTEKIKATQGVGTTMIHVTKGAMEERSLFLPPLAEQKRIVSIVDEAFEAIDIAIDNTKQNLTNARELFDSYLNAIFTQKGEGWEDKQLGDVCKKVEYGSSAKSLVEGKIPVLRMGNIQDSTIDWSNLVYSNNDDEINKYLLKYNDVLFNRTNSDEHVGKTAVYKGDMPAIFAGYLIRIHRKEDLIDADFLNFYLNSYKAREYGKSIMSRSVNQANINGTKLKDYPISLPSLSTQEKIVEDLSFLSAETRKLETIYRQKLTALNELKQSILHKAFTGELTADKADLKTNIEQEAIAV
jgi:type I restriction enzyme, S subunit